MPYRFKKAFSKFRCFNHKLAIELGRHNNIAVEQRTCNYCLTVFNTSVVDCEFHAFFHCHKYTQIRQQYLFSWYDKGCSIHDFYQLMNTNNDVSIRKICIFLYHMLYA